jgi:hypothetical protein
MYTMKVIKFGMLPLEVLAFQFRHEQSPLQGFKTLQSMLTAFGDDQHDALQASGNIGLPPHECLLL